VREPLGYNYNRVVLLFTRQIALCGPARALGYIGTYRLQIATPGRFWGVGHHPCIGGLVARGCSLLDTEGRQRGNLTA
jgi:hypothetical protein